MRNDNHWPSWRVFNWEAFWDWIKWPPSGGAAFVYFVVFIFYATAVGFLISSIGHFYFVSLENSPRGQEAAKILLPALIIIVGAPFLIWRLIVGHWAGRAALDNARASLRQAEIALSKQELDRLNNANSTFLSAVEMLGATRQHKLNEFEAAGEDEEGVEVLRDEIIPNIELRKGAIYTLGKIAHDNPDFNIPVLEIITGYIREQSWLDESGRRIGAEDEREPRSDIVAAVSVLNRRSADQLITSQNKNIDLLVLDGSRLVKTRWHSADISRMSLRRVDFRKASFFRMTFSNVIIRSMNLAGARLFEVRFEDVDFKQVNMNKARFNKCFFKGTFDSTTLVETVFAKPQFGGLMVLGCDCEGSNLPRSANGLMIDEETKATR